MSLHPYLSDILLLDDGFEEFIDLRQYSFLPVHLPSSNEIKDSPDIKAVITNGAKGLPEKLLNHLPNLEIISVFGVGTDRIPKDQVKKRGIKITVTGSITADAVADSALMFLLNLKRNFIQNISWMKNGSWEKIGEPPLGHAIQNAKIGIVGFGAIGQAIAHRLDVFGAEIRYYNRSPKDGHFQREENIQTLAEWADTLILAIPGTPETHHLITGEILQKLGSKGFLINVARGTIVDEKALINALQNNIIKGAGLDVFETEPCINPAFYTFSNCLLQPHQGSAAFETRKAMAFNVIENLKAHFSHQALITPLAGFA